MTIKRTSGIVALSAALGLPTSIPAQDTGPRDLLLIEPAELASIYESQHVVILHVGDRADYDAEHIAGAHYIQLSDISAPRSTDPAALVLELPEAEVLRGKLESLGVSDNSQIVVYYGTDWVTPATRTILTLTWAGLGNQTRLLDGGLNAWKEAGNPVTAEAPPVRTGQLSPLTTHEVVVTADWVREHLESDDVAIIDARAPRFFEGQYEQRAGQRPGHIAGARSIPFTDIVEESLRMKDVAALRALFRQAGVGPTDTVVAYCHIGQQATLVVFAARLIGQPVMLYDGSYTEWGTNPELPIETGGATIARGSRSPLPLRFSPLLGGRPANPTGTQ